VRRWAYALYLSARLGIVNGASLAQLRRELDKDFKNQWEEDVTALYLAGTYALYRQEELGEKLIKTFEIVDKDIYDIEDYLDPLQRNAVLMYMAGKHFPSRVSHLINEKSLQILMKPLNAGQYQTFAIGWLLMAFDVMAQNLESESALAALNLEVAGKTLPPFKQKPKVWKLGVDTKEMKLVGNSGTLFYAFQNAGFDRVPVPIKKGIEVARQYRQEGKEVSAVKMGDEVTVHIQIRSLDEKTYPQIAIIDLIPSGFEMIAENRTNSLEESGPSEDSVEEEVYQEEVFEEEGGGENDGALFQLIVPKVFAQVTSLSPIQVDFEDKREDRMILYATVTSQLTEFTYKIKAVNKGKFVVPPSFAEGMYNRNLQFLGNSSVIEVIHP